MSGEVVTANPPKDKSQVTVALNIVGAVTVIAIALIAVVIFVKDEMIAAGAIPVIGTIVGGLIQSLNSPTGIGSVIASAMAKPSAPT